MQLVKPLPFQEAVDKLGRRTNIGSKLSSSEWADVPVALRERAFFSARVESARVLQRARDGIADFLQSNREVLPDGQSALKTGSRADFVKQMQDFLKGEGIERTDGSLTDLASERRLGLIFNTQTRQANDYGNWRQGQDVDLLNEFPAQRFIRVEDVDEPRNAHTEFEGQVYLKTDPIWATINDDFGVPWGPWGWGCGHDVEDVDRTEAEQLGLIAPGRELQPIERDFNEGLQASTRGLDPDLLEKLKADFGDKITIEGDTIQWTALKQSKPSIAPTPSESAPKAAKSQAVDAAVVEAKAVGVAEVITFKNPYSNKKFGAELKSNKAKAAHLATINQEMDRLRKQFPNMPAKPTHEFLATNSQRGLATLDGPRPVLACKAEEWSDASWKNMQAYEKASGTRWGTERQGSQVRDNYRHELAHNLSTPQVMSEWQTIQDKYGFKWFRENVSQYAAADKKACESLAESFGLATRENYVRGTLPQDIEDFVFKRLLGEK